MTGHVVGASAQGRRTPPSDGGIGVFHYFGLARAVRPGDVSAPVPEPSTMLLLGAGLVVLLGFGRKKLFKK